MCHFSHLQLILALMSGKITSTNQKVGFIVLNFAEFDQSNSSLEQNHSYQPIRQPEHFHIPIQTSVARTPRGLFRQRTETSQQGQTPYENCETTGRYIFVIFICIYTF